MSAVGPCKEVLFKLRELCDVKLFNYVRFQESVDVVSRRTCLGCGIVGGSSDHNALGVGLHRMIKHTESKV